MVSLRRALVRRGISYLQYPYEEDNMEEEEDGDTDPSQESMELGDAVEEDKEGEEDR